MSKKAQIVEMLFKLQQMGVIEAHVKAQSDQDPNRLSWHVQVDSLTTHYMTTKEVEFFIEGCKATNKVVSQLNSN